MTNGARLNHFRAEVAIVSALVLGALDVHPTAHAIVAESAERLQVDLDRLRTFAASILDDRPTAFLTASVLMAIGAPDDQYDEWAARAEAIATLEDYDDATVDRALARAFSIADELLGVRPGTTVN